MKVVCINSERDRHCHLITGKVYDVLDTFTINGQIYYYVMDGMCEKAPHPDFIFITVQEVRNNKLNELV
jgi:hypothetical protein